MTPAIRIEKLMSLSEQEFAATIARLDPHSVSADGTYYFLLDSGSASVTYTPLPGVTLGGLMALPRARVALEFEGTTEVSRASFLKRFEFTFQRGGG